jgi:hypothetical protein
MPLTPRQIVLLAKKYHLMPVLYDMDKMMTNPNVKYAKGAIDFFCSRCGGVKKPKDVVNVLRLHKRLRYYARQLNNKQQL